MVQGDMTLSHFPPIFFPFFSFFYLDLQRRWVAELKLRQEFAWRRSRVNTFASLFRLGWSYLWHFWLLCLFCFVYRKRDSPKTGQILRQVASALEFLQDRTALAFFLGDRDRSFFFRKDSPLGTLVHNDLKMENILFRFMTTRLGRQVEAILFS